MPIHEEKFLQVRQRAAQAKQKTIAKTAFRETGIAWLGNEEGVVIIPPNERRHPAEAFWAYSDINGTRQVIRLANYDSSLTYSNKDVRRAVRIGIPPNEELLGVLGIATQDAKVFGPASPAQVAAKKTTYLTPDRWQMYRLSPAGGRRVNVEAGWHYDNGVLRSMPASELIDLDSYYPTNPNETRIVLLGWTAGGTPRLLLGDVFTRVAGDPITNHFPTAPFEEGDVPLGGAILTYGETELVQKRILPYLPFFEAIRTNILNGVDVTAIQGFLFFNEGTAYQVHCVGDQVDPPTVNADETSTPHPFGVLSLWATSVTAGAAEDAVYMCVDPTEGAAVWLRLDGASGGGTVTSVGLTMPTIFSVLGTPVTTSGTLAVSLNNQSGNVIFASPANGSNGIPTFRAMVAADIPDNSITAARLADIPGLSVIGRAASGTGDPGVITFTADNQFLVRRSGALTVGALVAADIPNLAASIITSGVFDNARINWAAPGAIGTTTPSAGNFTAITGAGNLLVSGAGYEIQLSAPAGNYRNFRYMSTISGTPTNRWNLAANFTAESGSNAGSDFAIRAFDDSGTFLSQPVLITRSNGQVTLSSLMVSGNTGFYGTTPIAKPTVNGSRGGNEALYELLLGLAALGLITNNTTA